MANTMIFLISDQAIPNLLSALKFRPACVFMLHTGEPRLRSVMDNLSGYLPKILPKVIIERMEVVANDPDSVRTRCLEICRRQGEKNVVINATCGTKLMAIGALQAGLEAGAHVIYVDTEQGKFLDLNRIGERFMNDSGLPSLNVDDFLGIYGARITEEKTQEALESRKQLYPLARFMIDRHEEWAELQEFFDDVKGRYIDNLKYEGPWEIRRKGKSLRCNLEALRAYKEAGLLSEIEVKGGTLFFCFADKKAKDFVYNKGNLLELFTFYTVMQFSGIQDIRLGVSYVWGDGVKNEIDVLFGVGSRLVCIECKSARKTEELSYFEAKANRLGGTFVKKIMVVGESVSKDCDFSRRAKEMRIDIVDLDQLRNNGEEALRQVIFGGIKS